MGIGSPRRVEAGFVAKHVERSQGEEQGRGGGVVGLEVEGGVGRKVEAADGLDSKAGSDGVGRAEERLVGGGVQRRPEQGIDIGARLQYSLGMGC